MLQPAGEEQFLAEADQLIDILSPDDSRRQLLGEDDGKMKADRADERIKKNAIYKGNGENADAGPSDEHRELEKLRRQLEEEMWIVL